ncbi:MAG TPA: hypothetical protein VII00_09425 [bacterium]
MKSSKNLFAIGISLFIVISLCPALLYADTTVERFTKSGGFAGIGASESNSATKISGLKKRDITKTKLIGSLGKFVTKMAGDMETDSITDINKDAIWTLNHKNKTYTENKISAAKEMMEGHGEKEEAEKEQEKPKVKVIKNEFSVKETGEKKKINGYDCTEYILTWLVETENIETKERAKNIMTNEQWNTPETKEIKALQKEETEFQQAYMKKMGMDMPPEEAQKFGLGMMSGMLGADEKSMQENMKKLQKELSKIKGYSITTSVKWENESTAPKQDAKKAPEPEEEEAEDVDVSQGIGGIMGGLAKKAAKKKMAEKKKEKEAQRGNAVFEFYSEIKKISTSSVNSGELEIPPDYKLTK